MRSFDSLLRRYAWVLPVTGYPALVLGDFINNRRSANALIKQWAARAGFAIIDVRPPDETYSEPSVRAGWEKELGLRDGSGRKRRCVIVFKYQGVFRGLEIWKVIWLDESSEVVAL